VLSRVYDTMHELIPYDRIGCALLEDNDQGMFVTFFLAYLDTREGTIRYVNAGHNPPYRMIEGQAPVSFGKATGPPLGILDGIEYKEEEIQLGIGENLILYTDGVTEARSPDGNMLEEEGFEELLAQHNNLSAQEICEKIVQHVDEFQQGKLHDDVTILVLRREM